MCRNIRVLYNFEPVATDQEIEAAALQFVRKISGFRNPSVANQLAFEQAVKEISHSSKKLLQRLTTEANPRNRETEEKKAHARALKRFG